MSFLDSLREETDSFLEKKAIWKYVVNCRYLNFIDFYRGEIETKLIELQSMQKDLTNKQQELDQRERLLEEREKELKRIHSKTSTDSTAPRVKIVISVCYNYYIVCFCSFLFNLMTLVDGLKQMW